MNHSPSCVKRCSDPSRSAFPFLADTQHLLRAPFQTLPGFPMLVMRRLNGDNAFLEFNDLASTSHSRTAVRAGHEREPTVAQVNCAVQVRLSSSMTILNPSFLQMCCMAWFSARIWPTMPLEFFGAANFDKPLEQFVAEAVALPFVADQHGKLRLVRAVQFAQASDAENFLGFVIFRRIQFGDERDLAVVIVEANARQPFVRDALRQFQRARNSGDKRSPPTRFRGTSPSAARLRAGWAGW